MEEKILHLTFDGAPHPPKTEALLKVLDEFGIKATFFMEGHRLEKEPETARRIIAAGHSVGNHSYSHRDMLDLTLEECIEEIRRTDELIAQELHLQTSLVRPPNGHISDEFADWLRARGKRVVVWNISVKDWTGPDAAAIAERTIGLLTKPEIIMVLHDFVEWNPEALRTIIPEALRLGYTFVPLPMDADDSDGTAR